jgi:hypothetical protein
MRLKNYTNLNVMIMKELSIEEKAKAYDEAIEKIQKYVKDDYGCTRLRPEDIFPELKENEDERIRKAIKYCIKQGFIGCGKIENVTPDECLAWLEKQGEQEETLCDKCKKTQPSHSCQDITALGRCALEKQGEYKPAFNIDIPFGAKDSELMEASYYIPEGFHVEIKGNNVVIKKGEQKPAWSEDDKVMLDDIIDFFENGTVKLQHDLSLYASWLKSIRPQNTWKPSGEQMAALKFVIESLDNMFTAIGYMDNYTKPHLEEILEALKKLREE